jgi:hypothetical protein
MEKQLKPAYVSMLVKALKLEDQQEVCIADLQAYFAGDDAEIIRQSIIHIVGKHCECPVVEGQRKAAGTYVLDKDSEHYEAAKKRLQRWVFKIMGGVKPKASAPKTKKRVDAVKKVLDYINKAKLTPKQLAAVKAAL